MSETQTNTIEGQPQPKIRDRLFIAIFGKDTERSKRWRLDLYNVLNGTNYTDPDALELNTIENVIYIKMYNDVSFLNMPLRGLLYFAELYQKHLAKKDLDLNWSSLVKIPNPRFVVFYNGETKRPERYKLRLSEAFEIEDKSGDFEWTADVINITPNKNESLVKKCKPLYDYGNRASRPGSRRLGNQGKLFGRLRPRAKRGDNRYVLDRIQRRARNPWLETRRH